MNIEVYNQASIKIIGEKTVYFDPYQLTDEKHDADIIFITHDHYDHFEKESIKKALGENTILVIPKLLEEEAKTITENILVVEPNKNYIISNVNIETIPSYNIQAPFHPKEKGYVGYNIELDNTKYYIMGDTDKTIEAENVKTDICLVPIGGTYTMDVDTASDYINKIKPKKAIPIHYGSLVGDRSLGIDFKNKINKEIEVEILIK